MRFVGFTTALLIVSGAAAIAIASASARPQAGSCSLVPPNVIHRYLGVPVTGLKTIHGHNSLTCSYSEHSIPDAVKVTWQTGVSSSAFAATKASASHSFPHITTANSHGYTAWYAQVGTGPYGSTMFFLHKGSSELDITATASPQKVIAFAHHLLHTL